jgi:hypothetical protein
MKELLLPSACLAKDQVLDYLEDRLDERGRFAVENHLLDCAPCRCAVKGMAASGHSTATLRADFSVLETIFATQTKQPARTAPLRWLAAAAAIALLLMAGWGYRDHTRPDRLFAAHFDARPLHGYLTTRAAAGEPAPARPEAALDWYASGEYGKSLAALLHYLEENPHDDRARLYAGLSALVENRYPEAAGLLSETAGAEEPFLAEEATWYLALTRLKQRQPGRAVELLNELAAREEGDYKLRAEALLGAIRER